MGTDIHGVFQCYDSNTKQWRNVSSTYQQHRDHELFAVLACTPIWVLNWLAVSPIAEPRGFPPDFAYEDDDPLFCRWLPWYYPSGYVYHKTDETTEVWMGVHSFSWLTGDEMLTWAKNPCNSSVVETGIVKRAVYESWDGKSSPLCYSRGTLGANDVLVNDNIVEKNNFPDWTHIHCQWISNLSLKLAYFFDEVESLVSEYGRVRFVFGFDS